MTKVNLNKLQATKVGNIESVIFETKDLPNGCLISLGEAVTAEGIELIEAIDPVETEEVLLMATVEMHYDTVYANELDYVTPAGELGRAYHLTVGDKFQVEGSLITGYAALAKGDVLAVDVATLGYKVAAGTERVTFVVEEPKVFFGFNRTEMARLRVLTV